MPTKKKDLYKAIQYLEKLKKERETYGDKRQVITERELFGEVRVIKK
jgi:hypothetical protein